MSTIWMELLILLGLVLLNGVFAMSEIAIVSARRVRLQQRADEGDHGAQTALELAADPGQFLSTVQIGITLIGIIAGVFGGATLSRQIALVIGRWEPLAAYGELIGAFLVVLLISYLSLVVGELVPKRIGLGNAEQVAARMAPAMRRLSRLTAPAVWFLTRSTDILLRLLGVKAADAKPLTETEIRMVIAEGAQSGVVEPEEHQIMERVFRLGDRPATALMTPRPDVMIWNNHRMRFRPSWPKAAIRGFRWPKESWTSCAALLTPRICWRKCSPVIRST